MTGPTTCRTSCYNMDGQRYYTYTRNNVRFVVLDSTQLDAKQVAVAGDDAAGRKEPWKICYFHHPLYSNAARHGSSVDLRVVLEPIFVRSGVNVVFSGHDHVYERVKPQKGIYYFVSGSAGQLRKGNMRPDEDTAAYFDQDQSFMLVEVSDDDMFFSAISRDRPHRRLRRHPSSRDAPISARARRARRRSARHASAVPGGPSNGR